MKTHFAVLGVTLLLLTMSAPAAIRAQDDCPPPIQFYRFQQQTRATVTAEAGINLRAEPSTGAALVGNVPDGADLVLDDEPPPVCADGYRWQHAEYAGLAGWVAEGRGGEAGYNLAPVILRSGQAGRASYQYDERLAGQIETRVTAPDGSEPGYDEAQFNLYAFGVGITEMPRTLRVYRTAEFAADSSYAQTVEQVRGLLHDHLNQEPLSEAALPLFPPLAGSEAHQTQLRFVDFEGGSGVRALVLYRDENGNGTLAYRFIGLTRDGETLLSLTFPLEVGALSGDLATAAATVEAMQPGQFTPALDLLDSLAASLRVDRAEGVVMTDPNAAVTDVAFGGIAFTLPSALAERVEFDLIAPDGNLAQMSMRGPQPGRTTVTFVGYPDANSLRDPILNVIDTTTAPEGASQFEQGVARLRALLDEQPVLATALSPNEDPVAQGLVGGAEPLFIQPRYVTFEGGRGIRYLTLFTQNRVMNVEPHDLYYAFEGLSDDGRYQIYALFPLSGSYPITSESYDPADVSGGVEGMDAREQAYIAALSQELDGIAGEAFTPTLEALDAVIGSLRVD